MPLATKRFLAAFWLFSLLAGSAHAQGPGQVELVGRPQKRGLVFLIGGIGGVDPLPISARVFLPAAGVTHEFRDFFWTHGRGQSLKDLQDLRHLQCKARDLANLIRTEKQRDPERTIYLLADSGGAGLALLTAEQLPPQTLERIVLTAAAVSPDYDLRFALLATRREIVSFYSFLDQFVLGFGTRRFGTADRYYVTAAGCAGFKIPENLAPPDRDLYQRLVQVPWQPRMILLGYTGSHNGPSAPGFLMSEVAPWLREESTPSSCR